MMFERTIFFDRIDRIRLIFCRFPEETGKEIPSPKARVGFYPGFRPG